MQLNLSNINNQHSVTTKLMSFFKNHHKWILPFGLIYRFLFWYSDHSQKWAYHNSDYLTDSTITVMRYACRYKCAHIHQYTHSHTHINTCANGTVFKYSIYDRTSPIVFSRLSKAFCILELLEPSSCITNAKWFIHSWWPLIYKRSGNYLEY